MVGLPHQGNYWAIAQRLFSTLCMAIAICLRAPFSVLAGAQLFSLIFLTLIVMGYMRLKQPILTPTLRVGSWRDAKAILRPSGHFGLISLGGFLTWTMPVILIQRNLGADATGIFGLVRTVFQMSRQVLMIASSTISQDITEMFGRGEWHQLRRLYDLSERVVLFLVPIVTIGTLLISPLLFTIWLHKRDLYQPGLCFMMALISGVLGIKEHKTQFQSSSNEHERLSLIIVFGYSGMLFVAVFAMKWFGLIGYLGTWLTWEILQTYLVLRLNAALFPRQFRVTAGPLLKMVVFTVAAFSVALYPAFAEERLSTATGAALAFAVSAVIALIAFQLFGLKEIVQVIRSQKRT